MNDNKKPKPKPTIEPIVIPEDKLNKLNLILNSNYSPFLKQRMIRQIAGGLCHTCGKIPTKILKYELEDITLIERYCSEHVPDKIS